jgi:DNA-binding transcriptional LysR family regulator
MEHRQLLHFMTVCEQQNFSKAAQLCFISQPGLSNSIRQLEEQLVVPLFLRNPTGIELTEFGRTLYERTKSYINLHDEIVAEIRNLRRQSASQLSLALPEGFIEVFPENFFRDFILQHPEITLAIANPPLESCQETMLKRGIPLGFCASPLNTRFFEILYSEKGRAFAIIGKEHPLASRSSIKLEELRNESVIVLDTLVHPQPVIRTLCEKAGVIPSVFIGVSDTKLYQELCVTNRFVYIGLNPINISGIVSVPVEEFENVYYEFNLIHNRDMYLSEAAEIFVSWTKERFKGEN